MWYLRIAGSMTKSSGSSSPSVWSRCAPSLLDSGTLSTSLPSLGISRQQRSLTPSRFSSSDRSAASEGCISSSSSSPSSTTTLHFPHSRCPPQIVAISTPSFIATSKRFVPGSNVPRNPDGKKTIL